MLQEIAVSEISIWRIGEKFWQNSLANINSKRSHLSANVHYLNNLYKHMDKYVVTFAFIFALLYFVCKANHDLFCNMVLHTERVATTRRSTCWPVFSVNIHGYFIGKAHSVKWKWILLWLRERMIAKNYPLEIFKQFISVF